MRHRGDSTRAGKPGASGVAGTVSRLTDLLSEERGTGRHRDAEVHTRIPHQKVPTHDGAQGPDEVGESSPTEGSAPQVSPILPVTALPTRAHWKASRTPRIFAAALLLLAVAGTSALGLRYAETRGSDEFISLVIGLGVIVGLWALLIASTPQVVSLRGSVLTVRNSSGSERFDLADGLQPVDVHGSPRSSQWALLLHRANNTSVVLRRRDVDAAALDPIVRHYRALAEQRYSDRQVRFSR